MFSNISTIKLTSAIKKREQKQVTQTAKGESYTFIGDTEGVQVVALL